jgi:Ca2+-binding RTX toxin-like protein
MPRVRIEWMPVQTYGLGHLGFDHLQLVLEQGEPGSRQDDWYVMEGVRDATSDGIFLGIEGADGRTTLSIANLAARSELAEKIGTPEVRGSRPLPYHGDEIRAWDTMSNYAREIEAENYPYIAFGLPGSPTPTINSSSAVASMVHYSGLDPTQCLPFGMRLSPGTSTLLGTGGDDQMRVEHGFTTLVGGRGDDAFTGGDAPRQTEKFFGGEGDDVFRWSPGFNIVHGGQPQLPYAADGADVIDYSGAGLVTITFNRHWIPHKSPNFFAVHEQGVDHLFSVERIQWNAKSDRIELGRDINLLEDGGVQQPHAALEQPDLRRATLTSTDSAVIADASGGTEGDDRLVGQYMDDAIFAKAGEDTLYGGEGNDILAGGAGNDGYIYLPGDGDDVIVDMLGEGDFDELLLTGGIARDNVRFSRLDEHLVVSVPGGSILISGFFSAPDAGIERIVFDLDPPLERAELESLAGDGGAGTAGFHPTIFAAGAMVEPGPDDTAPTAWHAETHVLALF